MTENEIGTVVIESAIAVHRELGPGLLETVYEVALTREMEHPGMKGQWQVAVTIRYKGIALGRRHRLRTGLANDPDIGERLRLKGVEKFHRHGFGTVTIIHKRYLAVVYISDRGGPDLQTLRQLVPPRQTLGIPGPPVGQ